MSKAELWTDLARVYKTSRAKLPVFAEFLKRQPEALERCIIFVETMEYGIEVLKIIHDYEADFHTYFGGEEQAVAEERLAPILMTALTTGLALVPLIVTGDRPGQEIEYPMAYVILGGLVTSTLLNLLVLPPLYLMFGSAIEPEDEA